MTSTIYDISPEEIDTIISKNIPSLIQDLMKLRNTFNKYPGKELPKDLKMSIFHIGKIHKIWELRKDQINKEMQENTKPPEILETKKPLETKKSDSGNDSDSDGSVSDIDYDQEHQDKINQLLKRCEMESSLARSSKGFTIERKPAYVIEG